MIVKMENTKVTKENFIKIKDIVIFILLVLWMIIPVLQSFDETYDIYNNWKEVILSLCYTLSLEELKSRSYEFSKNTLLHFSIFERSLVAQLFASKNFLRDRETILNSIKNGTSCPPFFSDSFSFYYSLSIIKEFDLTYDIFCLCLICEILRSYIARRNQKHSTFEQVQNNSLTNSINTLVFDWLRENFKNLSIVFSFLFSFLSFLLIPIFRTMFQLKS